MLFAVSFSFDIFPFESNSNSLFFCFSYSLGSIPTIISIRSSPPPNFLISFSIPLNILISLLPPNNLFSAFEDAAKPSATFILLFLTSLNFLSKSSSGEDSIFAPSPGVVPVFGAAVLSLETSVTANPIAL